MHCIKKEVLVKRPEETVEFFNTPKNLAILMPKIMGFKLLTPEPIVMKEGAVFDYTVTLFGLFPIRWTSYISLYDPPHSFVDIQLKGPNSYWHHEHRFESCDEGTRVIDTVHYMLPLGLLGRLANFIVMKPMVSYIFKYRTRVINAMFNGE